MMELNLLEKRGGSAKRRASRLASRLTAVVEVLR